MPAATMDAANSKAADFERRASRRVSRRVSVHGGDGGDELDDLDLDLHAAGISDGFRPTSVSDVTASDDDDDGPARVLPTATPSGSSTPQEPTLLVPRTSTTRPSSIAKPPAAIDSFALQHDGAMGPINQAFLSRQDSSATSTHSAEANHNAAAERPSSSRHSAERSARPTPRTLAASSAPAHEPAYAGPRGPAFPYGLYPQNTIGIPGPSMAAIPVGFPGMGGNYRRHLGPDGEEAADLVGPDGHTEQLPPYTRYPEEAYARKTLPGEQSLEGSTSAAGGVPSASGTAAVAAEAHTTAGASAATAAAASASAIPAIPGAGGIGLAPRNPEFDGPDPDSPQSRHTSRSFTTGSEVSHHEINTAAREVTEKPQKRRQRLQAFGRRRLWGIVPYWAICLLVTGLLVMGIVLGAVVGSFIAKQHKKPPRREGDPPGDSASPAVTVTVDATPIPTPADLPPLPTGTFGLPLIPNKSPNSCFNDTTQAQAWSCQIWFGSGMTIAIGNVPPKDDGPIYDITVNCNQSNTIGNNVFFYGEQPPVISTPQPLILVNDTLDPNRGPAWFKMLQYNKTVIVPDNMLSIPDGAPSVPGPKVRRAYGGPGEFHRKNTAQAGDKPWVCTWPDTVLEVFIYPNQNTSMYKISLTSTYSPSATPTKVNVAASAANGAAAPTATTTPSPGEFAAPPPPYPRVVKLEERRMPRSRPATCAKYHIKPQDGIPKALLAEPIFDPNGKPIVITISEAEPAPGGGNPPPPPPPPPPRRDLAYDSSLLPRESADLSDCGCLWMVT